MDATLTTEQNLRTHLGVPHEARRVMIVSESTHWDPNWLFTSKEYFRGRVRRTLDLAIDALLAQPRRVFSLECAFFAAMYWQALPARREVFRDLANQGRLRFTGSGVTTPDTLLPEDESLLRDLLIGQEWIRRCGMTQEPRVLSLPDSFGHSPGLPSLLTAAGVEYAAICRIDGMRFPGADMESASAFPRPGTTAEMLTRQRTADFVWRAPDGSEVLAHWHAYGYGHGDMIASGGLSRALGLPTSWPDRRETHVSARIDRYIDQLDGLAHTPYLLLAIGFDFVAPVADLVGLLDRWNDAGYERTGVWLVNAGLEDYFDLIACHRATLPVFELDPNPYWMGFYASRPEIKGACRDLGRRLVAADNEQAIAAVRATGTVRGGSGGLLASAWWTAATSNHHDYVTGTATDRVANGEQMRWLRAALKEATGDAPGVADRSVNPGAPRDRRGNRALSWTRSGERVAVHTPGLTAEFDERRGGAMVSCIDASGTELLSAASLELCSYADSGGLWRMGNEFRGGRWALRDRSSDHPATIVVEHGETTLRVTITGTVDGREFQMSVGFDDASHGVVVRTALCAPNRRTVTLATHLAATPRALVMHQPGAVVRRPLQRWYEPTFWPLHSFAAVEADGPDGYSRGLAIAVAVPTALHANGAGAVETVVARTAVKELAFGIVPVLSPAWGRRWGEQRADLALQWVDRPDRRNVVDVGRALCRRVERERGLGAPGWMVQTHDDLVDVITVKVADRGEGVVVRLRNWGDAGVSRTVSIGLVEGFVGEITSAWRIDSRERDIAPLEIADGAAVVEMDRHFASVRLTVEIATHGSSAKL